MSVKPRGLTPRSTREESSPSVAETFKAPEELTTLTIKLPTDLHRSFKIATLLEGTTMREVLEAATREWLNSHSHTGR